MKKRDVNAHELPSFNKLEDVDLRNHNRGAILANIYEVYKMNYPQLLISLEVYLDKIPKEDRKFAQKAMIVHLEQRGYTIGS